MNFGCAGAFLIPGGRFLVVNSRGLGLCLWDLGIHAGKVPEFLPVDVIREADHTSLCTGPTRDGLGIIIISYFYGLSDNALVAHEIYPCTSNPTFTRLGSIKYHEEITFVSPRAALSGDILVFNTSPSYIVV